MKVLKMDEVTSVSGGLTPAHGAELELAVAAIALVASGGTLALVAVGAAWFCYECGGG